MLELENLREKQLDCIEFTFSGDNTLVLADVGTGKTVITWTVLVRWMVTGWVPFKRVLILAPKRVCTDVWMQEIDEWLHLQEANLRVACAAGKSEKVRKEIIADSDIQFVLLNYENLSWLMINYPESPFDVLICDEIDKMKDRTTSRFSGYRHTRKEKQIAKRTGRKLKPEFAGLKRYRDQFNQVIGLTGTPASNHLLDLWAIAYVVDGGKCLGPSYDKFRREHFYQEDYRGYDWTPLPGSEKIIYDKLAPITFRIERDAQIPPVVYLPPRIVTLPPDLMKQYKQYQRQYIMRMEDGEWIESEDAMTAYGKLRQLANGFVYGDDSTYKLTNVKFNALHELIGELNGQQLMIIYHFKEQRIELQKRYPKLRYLGGGIGDEQAAKTMAAWNAGHLELLALQPASAGHGLNLQKSNAHHIAMLTQPESAGLNEQVIGRLRRTGNKAQSVFVHRIITDKTVDVVQDLALRGKISTQTEFLNQMRKRCSHV